MRNFIFVSPNFPSSYWRFCHALKNRGFNVLGIGDCPYQELSNECKFSLTEYYFCPGMENYDNEKRAVEYFKNKYGEIEFLESNNEFWLERDARLRSEFNVANGPRVDEIEKYKLKSLQKKYYQDAGLKCARFILVINDDEVRNFVKEVGYPVFVKPDNGVGAQDTRKIKTEDQLEDFLHNRDRNKIYIMEEFIDGQIISFDGVTNSRSEPIFYTSNIFVNDNSQIVLNGLDDLYYCVPEVDPVLVDMGFRALKSFGVKNRFFHLEWFVLKSDHPYLGKKGTIVPLEANMRPAGAYTPDLINFANSTNCYEIFADSIAFDENRQYMGHQKYFAGAPSRRNNLEYAHTKEEVLEKYRNNICYYGEYPMALRDDMGDLFFMAKFLTLDELLEFDEFVRGKK